MKICTYGGRAEWCQINRIDDGFRQLGHEVVQDIKDADIIYANNPWYDETLEAYSNVSIGEINKRKIILNVLDIPEHIIAQFDVDKLKRQLASANAVTSISEYTRERLKHYCGIDSTVIYQPIMPVEYATRTESPSYPFLFVGRKHDINKRVAIGVHALWILGIKGNEVGMVGHESIGWGQNLGLIRTEWLNTVYNSANFVFCLGKIEGLNLPVIEAMAARTIPIVCKDMTTRNELLPPDLFPEYDKVDPSASSIAMFIAQYQQDNDAMEKMKERLYQFYKAELEVKFKPVSVAQKILDTVK